MIAVILRDRISCNSFASDRSIAAFCGFCDHALEVRVLFHVIGNHRGCAPKFSGSLGPNSH